MSGQTILSSFGKLVYHIPLNCQKWYEMVSWDSTSPGRDSMNWNDHKQQYTIVVDTRLLTSIRSIADTVYREKERFSGTN